MPLKAKVKGYRLHVTFCLLPVEGWSNLESVASMQSSAQEVTMLFKLIEAAKDSWACLIFQKKDFGKFFTNPFSKKQISDYQSRNFPLKKYW